MSGFAPTLVLCETNVSGFVPYLVECETNLSGFAPTLVVRKADVSGFVPTLVVCEADVMAGMHGRYRTVLVETGRVQGARVDVVLNQI